MFESFKNNYDNENSFEKGPESLEKKEFYKFKNYHFVYKDNFKNREVVFECDADNIEEADELLKESTGIVAKDKNNIGCSFEEN
jgi:hypothetical protein